MSKPTIRPNTQKARLLNVLKDGKWHSIADIERRAGRMRLNSRISSLRGDGYKIEHRTVKGKGRATLSHQYRLVEPDLENLAEVLATAAKVATKQDRTVLDRDSTPRDEENRFRIYRLVLNEPELVATAATPQALGVAIVTLGLEGEFGESCIGILDTHGKPKEESPGTWVINPWDTEPLPHKEKA